MQCNANSAHVRLDVDAGGSGVRAACAGADDARVVVDAHCQALCAGLYTQTWISCLTGDLGGAALRRLRARKAPHARSSIKYGGLLHDIVQARCSLKWSCAPVCQVAQGLCCAGRSAARTTLVDTLVAPLLNRTGALILKEGFCWPVRTCPTPAMASAVCVNISTIAWSARCAPKRALRLGTVLQYQQAAGRGAGRCRETHGEASDTAPQGGSHAGPFYSSAH